MLRSLLSAKKFNSYDNSCYMTFQTVYPTVRDFLTRFVYGLTFYVRHGDLNTFDDCTHKKQNRIFLP